MINARAESIAEKPSFRDAFRKRRCLIPADGFYEWSGKKGNKQPIFITLPGREPFAFAGLWETWKNTDDENSIYKSCTIITTQASQSFQAIHHRMPVILKPRVYEFWLNPENHNVVELAALLKNDNITEFMSCPASKRINPGNRMDLYQMIAAGKPQQTALFGPEYNNPSQKD